jgi:hypothetical protein
MRTQGSRKRRIGIGRPGLAAAAVAMVAALALPGIASAKTIHFTGKATGDNADPNMGISFDLTVSKGRPVGVSNVYVERADYACANGADGTDRNFRMFATGPVSKNGKMSLFEPADPPGYTNQFEGTFSFPKSSKKKGAKKSAKKAKPKVTGWVSSEFGYDPESFDRFNCIAVESFTATAP